MRDVRWRGLIALTVGLISVGGGTAWAASAPQAPDNPSGAPGYFVYQGGNQIASGAATPAPLDSSVALDNPSGVPGYYVYQGGSQVATSVEQQSTSAAAAGTTCVDNVQVSSETKGSAIGRGEVDCTSLSYVQDVRLILWQRPASTTSGGWQNRGNKIGPNDYTPYDSGWLSPLSCTSGYTIHYEMTSYVTTPDGAGPEDWNSNNSRCQ